MPLFKIDDLQVWTCGEWKNLPKKYPEIRGFSTDSRNIPEGFAFVALVANRDGHDFAQDAVNNGASAVIASRELAIDAPVLLVKDTLKALQAIAKFHRLRFDAPVIGVTGSCGKTTTKEFLKTLLSWRHPLCTKENLNNEIGVALTLTGIDLRDNQCAIVEAGVGAPGQMEELAKMIEPDLALVTCVTPAHMERFVEISNIAKEKALLAKNAASGGWALLHHNLLSWKAFEELNCRKAILAPAEVPDVSGDLVFRYVLSEEGGLAKIDMCIEGGSEYLFEMPSMTKGMQENALLAIAAALMLGTTEEQIVQRLELLRPGAMRGSVVEFEGSNYYVDCYNASPASMKDALRMFLKLSAEAPRMFVVGDMAELGLASLRYHREIGENIPHREGDKALLIGRNAEIYKSAMIGKGWPEEAIKTFESSADAAGEIAEFKGWIFAKASRVCELEKALPRGVREALSIESADAAEPADESCAQDAEEPCEEGEVKDLENGGDEGEAKESGDEEGDAFDEDDDGFDESEEDFDEGGEGDESDDEDAQNADSEDDEDERFLS